tara:strand:- start:20872 stop:21243 length:372 start_codon:yes stop_codon:yes gene_type:complete
MVQRYSPAIPGYVFVNTLDPRSVIRPPNRADLGFLKLGDRSFAKLSPRAFESLRSMEKELLQPERPDSTPKGFPVGTKVMLDDDFTWGNRLAVVYDASKDILKIEFEGAGIRMTVNERDVRAI